MKWQICSSSTSFNLFCPRAEETWETILESWHSIKRDEFFSWWRCCSMNPVDNTIKEICVRPCFPLFLLRVFTYMNPQLVCLGIRKLTLVAFVFCHLTDTHLTWDRFARSLTNVAPVTSASARVTLIRALCHVLFIHDPSTPCTVLYEVVVPNCRMVTCDIHTT